MLENIGNAITCLPMERNFGGRISSWSRHVRHDVVAMATAVAGQRPCRLQTDACQRRIEHSSVTGVLGPNAWTYFDEIWYTTQIRTSITVTGSNINFLKFKMADSRHVGKCWKCYNTPTSGQIEMKLRWSHPTNTFTVKSSVLVVTANHTVNVLVLWGVEIKNIHNFDEFGWLCATVLQKK